MNKKLINGIIYAVIILCILLSIYFGLNDLRISIALYNKTSGWANFLQRFGEIPGYTILILSVFIYLSNYHNADSNFKTVLIRGFLFLGLLYLCRHLFEIIYSGITGNYVMIWHHEIMLILFLIAAILLILYFLSKIHYSKKIIKFSKFCLLLGLFGYYSLIEPLKQIWGRVRFRDLHSVYSNFTPWYHPNGFNGHVSFPSGHAAMAFMLLPLITLADHKNINIRIAILSIIILWALIIDYSRIVVGAHYASDVLFGNTIIILVFLLLLKNFEGKA